MLNSRFTANTLQLDLSFQYKSTTLESSCSFENGDIKLLKQVFAFQQLKILNKRRVGVRL